MTFTSVLLFCCAGIAVCAALVFMVETVVAFCLNEGERFVLPQATLVSLEEDDRKVRLEKAA